MTHQQTSSLSSKVASTPQTTSDKKCLLWSTSGKVTTRTSGTSTTEAGGTTEAPEPEVGPDAVVDIFFVGDYYYYNATHRGWSSWDWYPQSMLNMMAARFGTCDGCRKIANVKLRVSGTYSLGRNGEPESHYIDTAGVNLSASDTEKLFPRLISENEVANRSDIVVLLTGRRVMKDRKDRNIIPGYSIKDTLCKEKKYVFVYDPPFTYFGYHDLAHQLGMMMGAYVSPYDYMYCDLNTTTPFNKCSVQDFMSQYSHTLNETGATCRNNTSLPPPPMHGPIKFNITAFCEAHNQPPLSVRLYKVNITMNKCEIQCSSDNKDKPITFPAPDGVPCGGDVIDKMNAERGTFMSWSCPCNEGRVCFDGSCNRTYGDIGVVLRRQWNITTCETPARGGTLGRKSDSGCLKMMEKELNP